MPHSLSQQPLYVLPSSPSLHTIATLQVASEDIWRCRTESGSAVTGMAIDTWRVRRAPLNAGCGSRTVKMETMVVRLREWIKPWTTVGPRLEEGRERRGGCFWKGKQTNK